MRKFIVIFGMMVCALSVKAQETVVISWLTSDNKATSYGNGSQGATLAGFMECDKNDLLSFYSTAKSIVGIKQIQFNLDQQYVSAVSGCKVIIMQGNNINTATVKHTQVVDDWVQQWNFVDLDSVYVVDTTQRLYIGYEVTTSKGSYPMVLGDGTEPKQAWVRSSSGISNLITDAGYKFVFLIRATATVIDAPDDLMSFISLDMNKFEVKGDDIRGTIRNLGGNPLTSFKADYTVNGVSATKNFSGLNVAPGALYNFALSKFDEAKPYNSITVALSEPNGVGRVIGTRTRYTDVIACSEREQRVVLHEAFTSSTCGPCKAGNENFSSVLKNLDENKWVCIKYQMSWPGTGDPYYTSEGLTRRTFYNINAVPYLVVDGIYVTNSGSYTTDIFNQLVVVPAAAKTTGNATVDIDNKKVDFDVTINPLTNYNNPNLRFFAAIIEKKTFKNVKTNGEKEFGFVLKKFMTSASGENIGALAVGTPITKSYSHTFPGDYRLPKDATDPINNSNEHSVENFKALMVVYWVQDISTKDIYQAGKADPFPGYIVSVEDIALNPSNIVLYPNPVQNILFIDADADISQVEIYNIQGQRLQVEVINNKVIDTDNLASGVYMLRITSDKGTSVHKFVKQ